jgi:tRNA(Ile)-lysidine synthase
LTSNLARAVAGVLGSQVWAALDGVAPGPVVACSGGADSLALLALAAAAGLDPIAVHVDHGLRSGSDREAAIVAAAAARFDVRWEAVTVRVGRGASLEAQAREARYAALDAVAVRSGTSAILVGHTRDDQAETVLLNVLRGGATTGLGGMPQRRGLIVRPLLDVPRAATVELCARLQLTVIDDPMNSDVAHRRVWLRREVIPQLEAGIDRDLRALLARQAAIARDESDLLDQLGAELLAAAGDPPLARVLVDARPAVARRAVRAWLGAGRPPPPFDDVEAVLAVAHGEARAATVGGGDTIVTVDGRLLRRPAVPSTVPAMGDVAFPLPGPVHGCGVRLEGWVERAAPTSWPDGRRACVVDADVAGAHAVLRAARTGERFRPLGLTGTKLVRDALAEAGVPAWERSTRPVVAAPDGGILWVVGYRIADHARVTRRTSRFLWLAVAGEHSHQH